RGGGTRADDSRQPDGLPREPHRSADRRLRHAQARPPVPEAPGVAPFPPSGHRQVAPAEKGDVMTDYKAPEGFVRGNGRLDRLRRDPERAAAVAEMRAQMA